MVMMGHVNLPTRAIRSQIVSALDVIIQVERMRDGVRRVTQVAEVCNMEGDVITMNDIVRFEYGGEDSQGRLGGKYVSMHAVSAFADRLEYFGLDRAWKEALQEI
jgi:pilus assembly protein CpaF